MAERNEKDRERLGRVYQRMARLPNVDANDPDNIIIELDKECEHYRDRIEQRENRIKELHERLIRMQGDLNVALNTVKFSQLEAVQDNTVGEIIKALSDNGFNNISINAYKTKEE